MKQLFFIKFCFDCSQSIFKGIPVRTLSKENLTSLWMTCFEVCLSSLQITRHVPSKRRRNSWWNKIREGHHSQPCSKYERELHMRTKISLSFQVIQYPPPPPVATGPGLDRPLFTPSPDYGEIGYSRARKYYHDQIEDSKNYQSPTLANNRTYG